MERIKFTYEFDDEEFGHSKNVEIEFAHEAVHLLVFFVQGSLISDDTIIGPILRVHLQALLPRNQGVTP